VTDFSDFGLAASLLAALRTEGYETPTPIQAQAIPPIMALLSIILGFGPGAGSAIDRLFGLGWAIQWRDVWIGLGISVATAILYLFTALGSPSLASTAWLPITKMPERPKTGAPEV
jgi:hypothetical protein